MVAVSTPTVAITTENRAATTATEGGLQGNSSAPRRRCYVSLIQVGSWENVRLSTAPSGESSMVTPSSWRTKRGSASLEWTRPRPSTHKEATAFTKKMVQGKRVRLEFDQANAHIGHSDKYRRTLAYVFLEDGTFLNAEIIKQGYGFAYTRFPFKYMDEFRRYQREAREQNRGLWAQSR